MRCFFFAKYTENAPVIRLWFAGNRRFFRVSGRKEGI